MRYMGSMILCLLLVGCNSDNIREMERTLELMQTQHEQELEALHRRLDALAQEPKLSFELSEHDFRVEEQMFRPFVAASVVMDVKGEHVPKMMYVDVMLRVNVPEEQFQGVARQLFPVLDGHANIEFQHPLPIHGLRPQQVDVNMVPVSWYRSMPIYETSISQL